MAVSIEPISSDIILSCSGKYEFLWGFKINTIIGHCIDDVPVMDKNVENLKEEIKNALLEKLNFLPLVVENIDRIVEPLHYHGNIDIEINQAYVMNKKNKVHKIYLCNH